MYLLYLDESGTHGGSPVQVLAGLAIHEHDAWRLQRGLEGILKKHLPTGFDPDEFELHAAEIKSPQAGRRRPPSRWTRVPADARFTILRMTFGVLARFTPSDPAYPLALFGAVVDPKAYRDAVQRAYEEVLHKFDGMLDRQARETKNRQRGIVVHDRRSIEQVIQNWTSGWRERPGGRIGVLRQVAEVPLFADSRASRLIQAADFVSWALWRYYGPNSDERWVKRLWPRFDAVDGVMHGLIHVTHDFRAGICPCPPCTSRTTPPPAVAALARRSSTSAPPTAAAAAPSNGPVP